MGWAARTIARATPGFVRDALVEMTKAPSAPRPSVSITEAETPYFAPPQPIDPAKAAPYGTSVWVFTCVSKIARSLASLPVVVKRRQADGQLVEAPDHPAQALFGEVNIEDSPMTLWEQVVTHLELLGASVMAVEFGAGGQPAEIWPLMPQWLERAPGRERDAKRGALWEYGAGPRKRRFWDDELLTIRFFNPMDPNRAWSPLEALRVGLQADYHAQQTNLSMFLNSARPDAVLETSQHLQDATKKRLARSWREVFGGPKNAHKLAILSHGLTYREIQRTLQDMEYTLGRQITRDEILATYGVPPIMAGVIASGWGESEKVQRQMFWTDTVLPVAAFIDDRLTEHSRWLWPDDRPYFSRDLSSIQHIIGREDEQLSRYLPLLDRGVITQNGLIERLGWPPECKVPWGDVWWGPWNLAPISGTEGAQSSGLSSASQTQQALAARAWVSLPEPQAVRWPARLVGAKRASVLRLVESMAESFARTVRRILDDLAETIRPVPGAPFERAEWRETLRERGGSAIGDMIWEAWRREDEVMRAAGKAFRKDTVIPIAPSDLPSVLIESPYAVQAMATQTQRFATTIPETVWQRVNLSLAEGIAGGESERMLADRVQRTMSDYIASSPRTIARTEAHGAANGGTYSRWRDGGEVASHAWSAVGDERTRETHLAADGQEVALGEPFRVGDTELEFPGDPAGPVEEVACCRCITLPVLRR